MADRSATPSPRASIATGINSYKDGDVHSLAALISLLDNQRQRLEDEDDQWLVEYEHHTRVLDEIYALTQQRRWSRFGRRKRRIVTDELRALRTLLSRSKL